MNISLNEMDANLDGYRLSRNIKNAIIEGLEKNLDVKKIEAAAQGLPTNPEAFITILLEMVEKIAEEETRKILLKHNITGEKQ